MKRTIEIEDNLQDIVDSVIDDVKTELENYVKEKECDELPDLSNDLDYSGAIHDIIDGAFPVYTHEVNTIMYLHGEQVEEAFDDAGIGEKDDESWPSGWKAAAIYCYIEQEVYKWWNDNAKDYFDEIKGK